MSRSTDAGTKRRQRLMWAGWLGFAIVVIVAFVILANVASGPSPSPTPNAKVSAADMNIKTGPAPWPVDQEHLAARLQFLGLEQLSTEGTVLHIHQHLDIFVHGQSVQVPAEIGIGSNFISEIHTHDSTGIIHVESPVQKDYTLGQFMTIWGVKFDQTHLGGYVADASNKLQIYSNGQLVSGDPRNLKLTAHEEIVIVFGTDAEKPASIPSSYNFQQGL